MKVLVTGGNGFVGKHVVPALRDAGHEIIAPTSKEMNLFSAYEYPDGLINGLSYWFSNCDAVVHLAAICGGIGINKDNPGKFMYENLQMGVNLLEACRLAQVKKVVNLGTVCSYPKHTTVPFQERDLWDGYPEETNAPYGIAKKAVTELGIAYHKQYGLNVTNFLPVNMAGEYDHFDLYSSHVLPALIRKFEEADAKCEPYVPLWGTGSASREFLYAGDCARAIILALDKDTGPAPINLGTGREMTIKELARLVKAIGYYGGEVRWDPSKPDGQPRRSLDTTKAKNILRWEATTSIEETIAKTIRWYRANKQ
jgi:GDP-L-fucose synthase